MPASGSFRTQDLGGYRGTQPRCFPPGGKARLSASWKLALQGMGNLPGKQVGLGLYLVVLFEVNSVKEVHLVISNVSINAEAEGWALRVC